MITTTPKHLKLLKETPTYILYVDENPVYTIKPQCIKCKKCNTISYNTSHIAKKYCETCKKFFADIKGTK
ncbi:hypothetical protein ACFL0U_03070 [Pseudomonadota bacterium]